MLRSVWVGLMMAICCVLPGMGQSNAASLQSYFVGKEVLSKIDMPGTQKGIDVRFNKPTPMNWKEYSSRLKTFGVAIPKGSTARVTNFVVKSDTIEFQLDGGGFGTMGDDTQTTVDAKTVDKSDYEKSLEKQIAETDDPDKKASLQRDLDRERARRERLNEQNKSDAQIASQIKSRQVADKRLGGGSRINLRWQGSIPADELNPDAVMKLLADYVEFNVSNAGGGPGGPPVGLPGPVGSGGDDGSPTAHLKQGMKIDDVANLLGQGKLVTESENNGLKTQVFEYYTDDRKVDVTAVDGVVVKYTISSK